MDKFGDSPDGLSTQMGDALVARLARLEMQNANARRINIILIFGMVAALAASLLSLRGAGLFSRAERVLVGNGIVLQDANGITRGTWEVADNGASVLQLHDRNSVPRVKLSVLDTGDPGVALTDPRGRTRIVLGLLPDQGGTLAFADDRGNTRVVLGVAPDESSTLVFVDAMGATRAGLGVNGAGDPSLTLYENEEPPEDAAQPARPGGVPETSPYSVP